LNGVGAGLGAVAGLFAAQRTAALRLRGLGVHELSLAALLVVTLWLAARLAPFVPTIDWQKYKDALKPLLGDPRINALDVFVYAAGWLVVAHALRELSPQTAVRAWLLAAACVVAGQVVVVNQSVSLAEAVAVVAALPAAVLLGRLGTRTVVTALAAATVGGVVLRGLEPFAFAAEPQAFGWMPFQSSITGGLEFGYRVLLEKSFWYTCVVWLGARAGLGLVRATFACAMLLGAIEVAQVFIPGRTPETTDPVLALLLGGLLRVLDEPAPPRVLA
jgi:hypothetical protein